jgi:hypothetical protein
MLFGEASDEVNKSMACRSSRAAMIQPAVGFAVSVHHARGGATGSSSRGGRTRLAA